MNKARFQRSFNHGRRWESCPEPLVRTVIKNAFSEGDIEGLLADLRSGKVVATFCALYRWHVPPPKPRTAKTHAAMAEEYGEQQEGFCGGCAHFETSYITYADFRHGKRYHCKASGGWLIWRPHWLACGIYQKRGER